MSDMHRLGSAYIGPTESHKRFVTRLTILKAYLITLTKQAKSGIEELKQNFELKPHITLGMVTNPISNTQFQGIMIRPNEFQMLMKNSTDELSEMVFTNAYCDTWRVFDDYKIDLANEVARVLKKDEKDPRTLAYSDHLESFYRELKISLLPNQIDDMNQNIIKYKIACARFTRNAIEHRRGIVDKKSIDRWSDPLSSPPYAIGEQVKAGAKEVGQLITFTETLAEHIELKILKQVPNLIADSAD